ncbi:Vacuolar ATPase assembly integral membrane protein vma21 [Cyphellophora attinorum]|uniref:Vacuolar ATPase assembly integral membrane protein vma21 n=1 Tax=Cyphellophora attinorum TaxID=1664694 RepID=A0A0N0NRM7_9EURO|nr:Vacuolar ATPase assembly integral membrane protein vma21 [Phialophora attinorum]KPI45268.1 Vacuolar ATPase assembly integral membrane protein vma21 [Phialophora attinorum]
MATYRSNASYDTSEKPILSPAQGGAPPPPSDTSPAVPSDVIYKLLGFTLIGNATYAGAFAAVMANVVLIAYIVVAMREDTGGDAGRPGGGYKAGKIVDGSKKGQ